MQFFGFASARTARLVLLLLAALGATAHGQVVNVEVRRLEANGSQPWAGNLSAASTFQQNTDDIFSFQTDLSLQYQQDSLQRWLFLGHYSYWAADSDPAINNGYVHIRRAWRAGRLLAPEAFLQAQRNLIFRSDLRFLAGMGMRYNLIGRHDTDRFHLSLGSVYMYEAENVNAVQERTIRHRDHRLSTYLSLSWALPQGLRFISTTYYLPRLDRFHDYRLLTNQQLQIPLLGRLSYRLQLNILYDTMPPETIPRRWLSFTNGLSLSL